VAPTSKAWQTSNCIDLSAKVRFVNNPDQDTVAETQDGAPSPAVMLKSQPKPPSRLAIGLVGGLTLALGIGVWQLQPKQLPEGRPIGEAGKVIAFALPAAKAGEAYIVWRDGRKTAELPMGGDTGIQRVELSSDDVDIAGSPDPDLVLYTWTGGAHCCFTQVLIDGRTGRKLSSFDLGNADPIPFIPAPTKGLARAVSINVDDVTANQFGSFADSPMARILVVWDGRRFGLDLKRMKASMADAPPAFFINEPQLGEAATLGVQDFGIDEESPARVVPSQRGDRTKAYQTWMESEEARMRATTLVAEDVTTYGPMAAFLNERIYKGQAAAGIATVQDAYKDDPETAKLALAYYFEVLSKSRWFADLDRLNGGALKGMVGR
jgi:hypothetical protein